MNLTRDPEHLLRIIETTNAIVWEASVPDLRFSYVSGNAERLVGYPVEDWLRPDFWVGLLHPDDRERAIAFCAGETEKHIDHEFDYRARHRDGHYIWLRDIVSVVLENGDASHLRGVMIDITETKRLETELNRAKDRAEAADAAKSRFLAHVGHELRTPLNGILGVTQLLAMRALPGDLRPMIDVIDKSGAALLRLVENVLNISRNAVEDISLTNDWFDPAEIVDAVASMLKPEADGKGLTLQTDIAPALCGRLYGDAARVQQVLANLCANAVRYTASGSVRMAAGYDGDALTVTVADTGMGMTEAFADQAFEPFARSQDSYDACAEGLGLGLAIVKQIVERMDGEISLDTRSGVGTRVTVRLPMKLEASALRRPRANSQRRALCVDDNTVNAFVLSEMLRNCGYDSKIASNGAEAFEALEAGGFDIVFMDLRMPVLNGLDATRKIRASEVDMGRAPVPIVGVSAEISDATRKDCTAAGMDSLLGKPIRVADLKDRLEGLVSARAAA